MPESAAGQLPVGSESGQRLPVDPARAVVSEPVNGQSPGTTGTGGGPPATEQPIVEDPIEILVGMAERGEIDPWNINIIEVTDRFLSELERRRQLNLRVSGRTLFYASTLLRMKSEHLADGSEPEGEGDDDAGAGFGDDFDLMLDSEFEYEGRLGVIERLEREIQRRLDRKNMIIELKNIEKEERRRRRLADTETPLLDADDVVGIAHDEGYQDSATTVYEECLKCITRTEGMTLAELCAKLGWSIPDVYIPLLFLMLEGHCALQQEEFFGDIHVQIRRVGE
jgi:segregation and condensation protein A